MGLPVEALYREVVAPLPTIRAFVDLAAEHCSSTLFGLELATRLEGGVFGITDFLVRTSSTVKAGLEALCRFAPLINPLGTFRYRSTERGGALHYAIGLDADAAGMHLNELAISYIVTQLGGAIGRPLGLAEVWFAHSRRESALEVAAHFGCRVRFQAADSGFALSHDVLALSPRLADPSLFQFLEAQARLRLAQLGPLDIVTEVDRAIEGRLPDDVRAEAVAAVLGVSARTLQRDLMAAGTSYRDVLAKVRRRRREHLQSAGFEEAEIASQLGFSDARAMRRSLDLKS